MSFFNEGCSYGYDQLFINPAVDSYMDYNTSMVKPIEKIPNQSIKYNNPSTSYDYSNSCRDYSNSNIYTQDLPIALQSEKSIMDFMGHNNSMRRSGGMQGPQAGGMQGPRASSMQAEDIYDYLEKNARESYHKAANATKTTEAEIEELRKKLTEFQHKNDILLIFIIFLVIYILTHINTHNPGNYMHGISSAPSMPNLPSAPIL